MFLATVVLVVAVLFAWQQHYFRQQRPLVEAGVASADEEGPGILEQLGVPPNSQPIEVPEKRYGSQGRRGMGPGAPTSITWWREYEMPGEFETIAGWYRERLQGDGWVSFDDTPPSTVQRVFKRGNWRVTIGDYGQFPHPTRTRIRVELAWRYW
jgi:hypothetical protein